jgi:hypothetical protein
MQPDKPDDQLFGPPFPQPAPGAVIASPAPGQPAQPAPVTDNNVAGGNGGGGKKTFLIAGIIGGVLLLFLAIVVVVVLAGSGNKKPAGTNNSGSSNSQTQGPTAATSSGVQLTNDSISQDISSLNDDKDLPVNRLSDQSLGL